MKKATGLTVGDLMTSPVISVDENTAIAEVASLMVRRKINRVPVLRDGRLVGIVSRADISPRVRPPRRRDPRGGARCIAARTVGGHSPISIDVRQGVVYLDGEVERRSEKGLAERWVATIDWVGMISFVDLARRNDTTVRGVMNPDPICASEDTSVDEIAALMLDQMVRRVPIMRGGRVVGIISASDIVALFVNLHEQPPRTGEPASRGRGRQRDLKIGS